MTPRQRIEALLDKIERSGGVLTFGPSEEEIANFKKARIRATRHFNRFNRDTLHIKFPKQFDPQTIPDQLTACFKQAGLDSQFIAARIFDRDRLDIVTTTGTDRDENSEFYPSQDDAPHNERWANAYGLKVQDVTYVGHLGLLVPMLKHAAKVLGECASEECVISFYDYRALIILGDEDFMQFGYGFLTDPKKALVGLMSNLGTIALKGP